MDGVMEGSGKKKGKVTERMGADDLLAEFATKVKRGSVKRIRSAASRILALPLTVFPYGQVSPNSSHSPSARVLLLCAPVRVT